VAYLDVTESAAKGKPVDVEPESGRVEMTLEDRETEDVALSVLKVAADCAA
jgi:hypothetical protein